MVLKIASAISIEKLNLKMWKERKCAYA